jgi:pSer/pThr/pTyr-binding forkhead associated (FHA) protein
VATGGTVTTGSPAARGEETAYFLTRPTVIIGRSADCDITLDDPGVSRRHAEVRSDNDRIEILDLGSTNGIQVNGDQVTRRELFNGDRIELGSTALIYRRDES